MLARTDVLTDGQVESVAVEPLGLGASMMSEVLRLRLGYVDPAPPGTPRSLVVKLACPDPFRRQIADRFGLYRRELAFYRHLADRVGVRAPRCYGVAFDARTGEFTLVLEDLDRLRAIAQVDGCGWHEALIAVDALARLHAPWWDRTGELAVLNAAAKRDGGAANLVTTFLRSWPACRELAAERLPAEVVAVGDRWREVGPALARRIAAPATLCHGDFRLDNLRFDGDEMVVFDWQLLMLAHGAVDLAYFASQSLRTEARAGRDRELLERYVTALAARGVAVDAEDAWEVYRTAVLAMLIFPVTLYGAFPDLDPLGQRTTTAMLDRAVAAITELDACHVPAARDS